MEDNCTNKCRACLTENEAMLSLFEVYEHGLTLAMILKTCINNVEVSEDDGLPSYLCDNCILVLTQFYNFTVVYEESDRYLRSLFAKDINLLPVEVDVKQLKEEEDGESENQDNDNVADTNSSELFFDKSVENSHEEVNSISELVSTELKEEQKQNELVNVVNDELQSVISTLVPIYEEVTKYECTICGEEHLFASAFQQHMRVKHKMTDIDCSPYSSKVHIKVFEAISKKQNQAQQSKKNGLENSSNYVCKYCKKKFAYASQLQQHLKLHEANKKYVCEVCGARFIRKTYLDDHKEGHSTEKKHVCKFCGKAFRRRTVLRAHKRVHTHPNHYVCEQCGRAFTNSSTLKTHKLLIHVRERNFHCVICNLKFPLKSTLNKHIIRHQKRENGEKGFNCSLCPMQYRDKSSLKRHVDAKHKGKIESVPCYSCPKRYSSKANLLKHIRRHHSSNMVIAEEIVL